MAIISRMDKAVATAAVFSITILEGGGMVLAKYFREEGEATGLEKGRKESQAKIEALQKRIQELEARNGDNPEARNENKPEGE